MTQIGRVANDWRVDIYLDRVAVAADEKSQKRSWIWTEERRARIHFELADRSEKNKALAREEVILCTEIGLKRGDGGWSTTNDAEERLEP